MRRERPARAGHYVTRLLVYTHRWLGIAGCVLFLVWFASGVVMMYARMPSLSAEERLARLPPLNLSAAPVQPAGARAAAGRPPGGLRPSGPRRRAPPCRCAAAGRFTASTAARAGQRSTPTAASACAS